MSHLTVDPAGLRALLDDADRMAALAGLQASGGAAGAPLVVVDLDAPAGSPPPRSPGPAPFVVVGVGGADAVAGTVADAGASGSVSSPAWLDVLLTESSPPRGVAAPWVEVADVAEEVGRLSTAAARSPRSAVALAHVLRSSEGSTLAGAVTVESLAYSALQAGPEFARWLAGRPRPPSRPVEGQVLGLERVDDELRVVLDRPRVRNAVNAALRDELCEALGMVALDRSIARVRLSGRGPAFCSGGDLDEFGTAADPASAHLVRMARSVALALDRVRERTIAQLHGACVGAGIEIAAAAGRVVAAPGTRIRLPEVAMGLIPGAGGTGTIPRRIGRHRTAWLALSGAELDAERARQWGLVDEVA